MTKSTKTFSSNLDTPKITDRKRGSTDKKPSNSFLDTLGIDLSQIQIKIALKEEDKEMLKASIEGMSSDVKKYWTRTHILMILIAVGSFAAQVI